MRNCGSLARWIWCVVATATFAAHARADCTDPTYAKLKPPKYPQSAVAARVQGNVLLRATVGTDGTPADIAVEKSSGDATLDTAAEEAVAAWSFNPRVCDGVAMKATIIVPVRFDLSEFEAAAAQANAAPSSAGSTQSDREIAADYRPIPHATAAELLKALREDPDVTPMGPAQALVANVRISYFTTPSQRQVWEVLQSDEAWTASAGGSISVISTRFVEVEHATRELYAQRCDGAAAWCANVLDVYLKRLRDDPPPIPPPAPAGSVGRAQR